MMLSPALELRGAVLGDPPDHGVAVHYGDPYREQRMLASGTGLVDRSHFGVVRIRGEERLSWLHSLTSQHLTGLEPGVSADTLVLSPHGHVEHALALIDDGTSTWIYVEPGTADQLLRFLYSMQFMLRVDVDDVTADYALLWAPTAEAAGDVGPSMLREGRFGTDILVPRSRMQQLVLARREGWAGMAAYEALRVAAGVPRIHFETDHRTLPHELDLIGSAVHLNKGCYRGQETVARVHNLGRPPRRLVRLHLDGSVDRLPEQGSPVKNGSDDVGFVGTAVRHFELGPLALALVRRALPVDTTVAVGGIAASQEEILPADTGPAVDLPRLGAGLLRHPRG